MTSMPVPGDPARGERLRPRNNHGGPAMLHRSNISRLTLGLTFLAGLAISAPAVAGGPPSFSFQVPDGPATHTSSSPVLIVHAFSCHEPTDAALTAHAEGIVGGERRTIPLKLESSKATGVYLVARQWPSDGSWALVFSLDRGGRTTAIVKLDSKGNPIPEAGSEDHQLAASSVRTISGMAKKQDIDTVLTAKLVK